MTRFDQCLAFTLQWEGGYSNDADDPGGATNKGITQSVYDAYRTAMAQNRNPVVGISGAEVADIYRTRYWNRVCCDQLPVGLDLLMFDTAVNLGVAQASKFLQRAVGAIDDGVIGKATLAALKNDLAAGDLWHTVAVILAERRDFCEELARRKPVNQKFLKGWLRRVDALEKELNHGA